MKPVFANVAIASGLVIAGHAHATVVYFDDFDGSGGTDLNGTTPDTSTTGQAWVASATFKADGSLSDNNGASATLALPTLEDNFTYTLDASLAGVTGTGWLAVGFAAGQSTANNSTNNRFITASGARGIGWTIFRGGGVTGNNNAFGGPGTGNSAAWAGWASGNGGDVDIRIVLTDTDASAGQAWAVTWFAKRPSDGAYTEVRSQFALTATPDSVGFALNGNNASIGGALDSFQLTAVPEPASLALLTLGGLLIARRRRATACAACGTRRVTCRPAC